MNDVEILGPGPAGSYPANAVARKGYPVRLVDLAAFPRDKLCGPGLTRKPLNLIAELEPSFGSARLVEFVHDLHLFAPDGEEYLSARLPGKSLALVHRRSFDGRWLGRALDAARRSLLRRPRFDSPSSQTAHPPSWERASGFRFGAMRSRWRPNL